eukprot:scaffold241701_cov30-Tisochrysis_lutea.AAC.5
MQALVSHRLGCEGLELHKGELVVERAVVSHVGGDEGEADMVIIAALSKAVGLVVRHRATSEVFVQAEPSSPFRLLSAAAHERGLFEHVVPRALCAGRRTEGVFAQAEFAELPHAYRRVGRPLLPYLGPAPIKCLLWLITRLTLSGAEQ